MNFLQNKLVVVCGGLLLFVVLLAFVGPLISPHDYLQTDFEKILQPPGFSGFHLFGTDDLGRDLFVRTLLGVQVTILVALVASAVSLIIGVLNGAIAGLAGGRVDAVMMRFVDTLYALPFIFFVILLMVAFERNFLLIFIAIGAVNWLDMARIVRGQTLSLREREFVKAAELTGVSFARIILRHIAPNLIGVVVVYVTLTIPQAITTRAATADDRDWLVDLRGSTMDPHLIATGAEPSEAEHQARVDADFDSIRILCVGSERVGMCKVIRAQSPWKLVQIQVVPSLQGIGIGEGVVTSLLRDADKASVPVELNVLKVNPAQRLYQRLGFDTVTDRDSALTMRYTPDAG